jgi:hypothetical protein
VLAGGSRRRRRSGTSLASWPRQIRAPRVPDGRCTLHRPDRWSGTAWEGSSSSVPCSIWAHGPAPPDERAEPHPAGPSLFATPNFVRPTLRRRALGSRRSSLDQSHETGGSAGSARRVVAHSRSHPRHVSIQSALPARATSIPSRSNVLWAGRATRSYRPSRRRLTCRRAGAAGESLHRPLPLGVSRPLLPASSWRRSVSRTAIRTSGRSSGSAVGESRPGHARLRGDGTLRTKQRLVTYDNVAAVRRQAEFSRHNRCREPYS